MYTEQNNIKNSFNNVFGYEKLRLSDNLILDSSQGSTLHI